MGLVFPYTKINLKLASRVVWVKRLLIYHQILHYHYRVIKIIAKVSGDGIKEYNSIVYLNNSKVKYRLYISRTDQYLASIKRAEAEEIITSANNQLQKWMRLYSISSDNLKIVDDGTWAVIKLDYRGNTVLNRDSLFAILHKDLNEWKVAANPEIVVSKIDHPNIPSSAILEASPVAPPAK